MEKTMKFLSMAALALMGVVMTGCSSDSDELFSEPQQPENKDKVETLTTTVSFNDGVAATRALTEGGVKTFAVGDQIAVAYKNSTDEWVKAVSTALTADDITNGGKSAKFTVTVSNADKTKDVKYIYPASIADDYGFVDYKLLDVQDGSLTTLASSLDACQGIGAWNGENLPALALENQFTICKFKIKAGGSDITSSITQLTINDGSNTYTITPTSSLNDIWVAIRSDEDGKCTYKIYAAKGKDLYTKTVSGKAFDKGKIYPINVTTTKVDGAISGQFTVNSSGKKVYFSQGNLQAVIADGGPTNTYNYAASSWQFAEHQWDFIGNAAGNTSFAAGSTVDLFGWVGNTAAYDTYGLCTFVTNNNNQVTSHSYFGSHSASETLGNDWGTLAISNGGNTANSGWRTLTSSEWNYLFNTRSGATVNGTSNVRYTLATINTNNGSGGVRGAILFPDGVTIANGEATSWGALNSVSQWNDATKCTTTQWTALAAKGCVFLPITGYRSGTTVEQATYVGHYWSSTPANNQETKAISLMFSNQLLFLSNTGDFRCNGHAVRLVKDVE